MNNKKGKIILGIVLANIVAVGIIAVSKWAAAQDGGSGFGGVFVWTDFIIVPLLMGIICSYFWRDLQLSGKAYTLYSVINSALTVIISYFFLKEGYICLIIVSPLLMGFNIAGVFLGKVMFKRNRNTMNVSVVSLLMLMLVVDVFAKHDYQNEVSDTMIINATPQQIWQYVVAYEPIHEKENYWLFQVGMPSPVQSTVDAYAEGAGRKCIFSNGYVFDEKMTVFKPNQELTFDIMHQPRDPEIMGHIDILRGQFILKDNGNGTTTLTGNSWYSLHVFPVWYFDMWASNITRQVHLRVMEHIKKLSEKHV
jgi:hypothetical protein